MVFCLLIFKKILYEAEHGEKICDFDINWNMREIALWMESEGEKSKDKSAFVRITRIAPQNISLKGMARLTCMKSFSEKHLKEELPKCLHNYIGLKQ